MTKKWWQDKPKEYWYRMGDIGMQIAYEPFRHLIEEELGQTVKIINGHRPLYIGLQSPYVDNYDEEACHLDLVAAKLRPNLQYWIHAIAEVPYTINGKKMEVPVKRILQGTPLEQAVSRDAMSNPDSLGYFIKMVRGSGAGA